MASGICLLAGYLLDDQRAGLTANLGAFVALYGSGRPYRNRARLLALIICGLVLCVAVGVEAAATPSPWAGVVVAALIAAVASFFCSALNVGPPGAYMFMLACAAGTTMYGQVPQLAKIAMLVAAGGMVSWVLHMLGALWQPRGPEQQAVSNAASAVADFIDSTVHGPSDLARHKAATSLHDAWRALIAWQPSWQRPHAKLRRLQARSRALHGLFAAAVRNSSAGLLDPKASAEAQNVESGAVQLPGEDTPAPPNQRHSFFKPREMLASSFAWTSQPSRTALRVGFAALIAGSVGALTGLERSYWAAAAAVLILHQGLNWVLAMQRGLERTLGTMLGLVFAAILSWLHPVGLALVACIVTLQFAGQLFTRSNYALAVFFFTPMALLMATAGRAAGADVGNLLLARGLDTMIGCAVGLAVLLATYRTDVATVRSAVSDTLAAAKAVLPFLSRGDVTTVEARVARRRLRTHAFELIQLYEEQAGGTARAREEADQTWPAIVGVQRLAFRILAACWEIEADGDAAKHLVPMLFDADGEQEIVRALNSLQAGKAAAIPRSSSNFLVPEIVALNESLPP